MIPLFESHFPENRVNSFLKSVVVCFYLTFFVINGFHHHAFSLSTETRCSSSDDAGLDGVHPHDYHHCPVCIFSASQDVVEQTFINITPDDNPVMIDIPADRFVNYAVAVFYSPRAPPVISW